ncbi:MAG: glycosyltransferase [Nitrospiraceae bacterium]|nr:glycosyltransferase [Nitrospiraceae bacterium]
MPLLNAMTKSSSGNQVRPCTVFTWQDYLVFTLLSGLGVWAIMFFLASWLTLPDWRSHPITSGIMTLMLGVILVNNQARWLLLPLMRRPEPLPLRAGLKVAVVTTFVGRVESLEMLEKTVRAMAAIEYPHDTWVLDESDDERVKVLCDRLGAHHFSRKHLPHYQTATGLFQAGSKHGNYNAWLYELGFQRYEFMAAFDPDHVPRSAFLSKVLGYFDDPNVGYVQAAQAYYNQNASFIARGAAEETYAYYSSVQMASYGLGYPIVIGCHNTHRIAALQHVGGFAPHDADDLLITLQYRSHGWQGVYVPKILAKGLTPVDWHGYLAQQRRWARSILDLKIRLHPKFSGKLPFKSRAMSFLHGLNYLHKSLLIPTGLLLIMSMLILGPPPNLFTGTTLVRFGVLIAVLQVCEFYRQRFYLDRRSEWGWHWRAGLLQFAKWPYLLMALCDVLINRRLPYVLTPKVRLMSKPSMMWPQLIVASLISIAWMIGMVTAGRIDPFLHLCAALIVIGSLVLVLTERRTFPDPFPTTAVDQEHATPLRRTSLPEVP